MKEEKNSTASIKHSRLLLKKNIFLGQKKCNYCFNKLINCNNKII